MEDFAYKTFIAFSLLAIIALLTVLLYGFWSVATGAGCANRWSKSGMNYKHSFVEGCFVEVSPGKWLPADRVRYDIPKES